MSKHKKKPQKQVSENTPNDDDASKLSEVANSATREQTQEVLPDTAPDTPFQSKAEESVPGVDQLAIEPEIAASHATIAEQKDEYVSSGPAEPISTVPPAPEPEETAPPAVESAATTRVIPEAIAPVPKPKKPRFMKRQVVIALVILLIAMIGAFVLMQRDQGDAAARADKQLIAEVSERTLLPKDEVPTITTVVDEKKLDQQFFLNARKGDKVLVYFQAGKAILYRPSSKQIVNIGPVTQPPAQVFLRAGSAAGIPASITERLSQPAGFQIVSRDVSPKQNYKQNIVVDLAGNRPDVAARIANLIGGKVQSLPDGESRPDGEFLVIVGSETR